MSILHAKQGFTLIESMVVIAITSVVIAAASPAFGGYLQRNAFDVVMSDVVSVARSAQMLSQSGSHDASWGMYVSDSEIILFQGESYATRVALYDQVMSYANDFSVDGTVEYVFEAGTGRTQSGVLTISSSESEARTITINSLGMIDF